MKVNNLLLFLFAFIVGLSVTEGQQTTEVPTGSSEETVTEETSVTDDDPVDYDNSTSDGEGLAAWTTR